VCSITLIHIALEHEISFQIILSYQIIWNYRPLVCCQVTCLLCQHNMTTYHAYHAQCWHIGLMPTNALQSVSQPLNRLAGNFSLGSSSNHTLMSTSVISFHQILERHARSRLLPSDTDATAVFMWSCESVNQCLLGETLRSKSKW